MVGVKAYFERPDGETEIRRMTLDGDSLNFKALADVIAETFTDICADEIHALHWKDEDDDFIAFSSDKEFREALKSVGNGTLKVYVRVKTGFEQPGVIAQPNAAHNVQAPASANSGGIKLNQFEVDEHGQAREPFWGWFFRQCAKRCVVKAWLMTEKSRGAADVDVNMSPDEMKESMLPGEFRDWYHLVMNEAILRAIVDAQKDCQNRCPFSIPPFFFHNINRCLRKGWIKLNGLEDGEGDNKKKSDKDEQEELEKKKRLPRELQVFFRRDAVVMWHKAIQKAWESQNPEAKKQE